MEAAGPVTVLAVLDVLYAFFLAVQCAALFGGADYLARVGISYASYARSGFPACGRSCGQFGLPAGLPCSLQG